MVLVALLDGTAQSLSVGREEVEAVTLDVAVVGDGAFAVVVHVALVPVPSDVALVIESRRFVMKTTPRKLAEDTSDAPVIPYDMDEELNTLYGHTVSYLTRQDIAHLLNGGPLVFDDGEYVHVLLFKDDPGA